MADLCGAGTNIRITVHMRRLPGSSRNFEECDLKDQRTFKGKEQSLKGFYMGWRCKNQKGLA